MWFAKLVTTRDPVDPGNQQPLPAFAKGHPALQYLINRDESWPEVSTRVKTGGRGVIGIDFHASSPLRHFGYRVGVSSGLPVRQRRAILADFIEARQLVFDEESSTQDRAQ